MLYFFTFVLAFCSIVYELLLGQSLSAFLGNTVLRYSVTIGLYMLSMGMGALVAEGRFVRHPVIALLRIELLLTITGGFSVLLLHGLSGAGLPEQLFSALAHGLVIVIGILTGFEIPLLIELKHLESEKQEDAVLGIDYLGAFFGTVVFAFVFYPIAGLVPTAFFVASLNALVGVALVTQSSKVDAGKRGEYRVMLGVLGAFLVGLLICLSRSANINEYFIERYLDAV